MKEFLRENPTIAFGLGLPLLLVMIFLLVSGIPNLVVSSPQYDVLYATEYYNYQNGIQISVVEDKVQVIYQGRDNNRQRPRIWRYSPNTGAFKEVSFIVPSEVSQGDQQNTSAKTAISVLIDVPDLEDMEVDSSSIAPDGYEFSVGNRYSRNVFGGLFYSNRYRHEAVLTKNGRSIRLPKTGGRYYRGSTHFIGWVVSP